MDQTREQALKRMCDFLSSVGPSSAYRPAWVTDILKAHTLFGKIKPPLVRGAFETALRCGATIDSEGKLVVLTPAVREALRTQPKIAALEPFASELFSPSSKHQGIFGKVLRRPVRDFRLGNPHTGLTAEAEKGRTGRWGKGGVPRGGRPRPRPP